MHHVRLAGGVDVHQRGAQEVSQVAGNQAKEDREDGTLPGHPVHPVALGSAVILAYKGDGRLVEGVHGDVDKVLDVGPGGGAGHQNRVVKGVEGGLNHHVGQGKHHPLKAGGQTDL